MKKIVVLFLLLAMKVCAAQTTDQHSLLIRTFAAGMFAKLLPGFSFNIDMPGSSLTCTGGTLLVPIVAANCVASVPLPPVVVPISRINQAAWGALQVGVPVNEQITQQLGWTVATTNSLLVQVAMNEGGVLPNVFAISGKTQIPLISIASNPGRTEIGAYLLSNVPAGISSILLQFNNSNVNQASIVAAEYAGLVGKVLIATTSEQAFVTTPAFTTLPVNLPVQTSPVLVVSGTSSDGGPGTWSTGAGYNLVAAYSGTNPESFMEDQIVPLNTIPLQFVGNGQYNIANNPQYLDTYIVILQ